MEFRGEGSLFCERDLQSALLEDTEDEEELVCWVTDVGWEVLDRELLRGDIASSSMVTGWKTCQKVNKLVEELKRMIRIRRKDKALEYDRFGREKQIRSKSGRTRLTKASA